MQKARLVWVAFFIACILATGLGTWFAADRRFEQEKLRSNLMDVLLVAAVLKESSDYDWNSAAMYALAQSTMLEVKAYGAAADSHMKPRHYEAIEYINEFLTSRGERPVEF